MRLLINATAYGDPPGGAGLRARALFGAMDGHELVFLLAEDTPAWVAPEGALVRRLPVRASTPLRRFLALDLPDDGDVMFTDHYPAANIPTVITLHDTGGGPVRRALIARHLRRAAAVVCVSDAVRRAWGVEATVVHNGVELAQSSEPGDQLLFCDPGLPHKGAETARAVARAVGRPLREVGRGVGWLDRAAMDRELASAAVVLCPSREEGFGMVALEAMGAGRPVVVSDLPAYREVCGDAAYYAPPGDDEAWVSATAQALEAPAQRLADARRRAARFTWSAAAARLDEVIASLQPATTT